MFGSFVTTPSLSYFSTLKSWVPLYPPANIISVSLKISIFLSLLVCIWLTWKRLNQLGLNFVLDRTQGRVISAQNYKKVCQQIFDFYETLNTMKNGTWKINNLKPKLFHGNVFKAQGYMFTNINCTLLLQSSDGVFEN